MEAHGGLRIDPDDGHMYDFPGFREKYEEEFSNEEINAYWEHLPNAPPGERCKPEFPLPIDLSACQLQELHGDISHFNWKFGLELRVSLGRIRGMSHLASVPGASEELRSLLEFHAARGAKLESKDCQTCQAGEETGESTLTERGLRFRQGDRVLCNLGIYWGAGKVLDTDCVDPEDPGGPRIAYLIKLDANTGYREPTSVLVDDDSTIFREVCFDILTELQFTKVAAPLFDSSDMGKPLRFQLGMRVACRVRDRTDYTSTWELGSVKKLWPRLPPPHKLPYGRATAKFVPYLVQLDEERSIFVHWDDHTLIRLGSWMPQGGTWGIARRFEMRFDSEGVRIRVDHQTMKVQQAFESPSDGDESV